MSASAPCGLPIPRNWPPTRAPAGTVSSMAGRHASANGIAGRPSLQHWRDIARGGAKAFYEGEIAAEIVATLRAKGAFMSEEDLGNVEADWVDLISTPYGGHNVLEIPPNGQGVTALILLRLFEKLGTAALAPGSAERWHMEIEAGRPRLFGARSSRVGSRHHDGHAGAAFVRRLHRCAGGPHRQKPPDGRDRLAFGTGFRHDLPDGRRPRRPRGFAFINSLYAGFRLGRS